MTSRQSFGYLLLIFPLNANSSFNALPGFYECLPLRNFARVMGEYTGNVGANIENAIGANLYKFPKVNR